MDQLLRDNLLTLLAAYIASAGGKESTIAQRAAGDWRFFKRLRSPSTTFTIRKYEETVEWFGANWPEAEPWPQGVPKLGQELRVAPHPSSDPAEACL